MATVVRPWPSWGHCLLHHFGCLLRYVCTYVHVLNRMVYVRIVYVYVCMYVNERLHGTKLECTYVAALARRKIPDIVRILMQAGTAPW